MGRNDQLAITSQVGVGCDDKSSSHPYTERMNRSSVREVKNPPNPWAKTDVAYDLGDVPHTRLDVYEDHTRNIVSRNDSPDLGFRWSVNPYRGCFHGCAYCYARPTHEYLSFGAGSDFERKIVIKPEAAALLREAFEMRSWKGEVIVFSGNTDCYQPLEASYGLTRGMLEACLEYKNPVGIITKSPVIERDVALLVDLSRVTSVTVVISIPFWQPEHAKALEPFVTTPVRRMRIIERLAAAGIRTGIHVAPIVPGLNEGEMLPLLAAAARAGAQFAGHSLLRLPGSVKEVFEARIRESLPLRAERILRRIREMHDGKLYRPEFGVRQRGSGPYAEMIHLAFDAAAQKAGLATGKRAEVSAITFQRPGQKRQLSLFPA